MPCKEKQATAIGTQRKILSNLIQVAIVIAKAKDKILIFFSLYEFISSAIKNNTEANAKVSVCRYLGQAIKRGDRDKTNPI